MAKIADGENLRLAFWKAAKGKRGKADCLAFREGLEENLTALGEELLAGDVSVGDYHYFKVHDPKERLICAAAFRERVLHHALMNVCEPVLERAAVFDSYACRKGKGRLRAVDRAQGYARGYRWFLKMDIRQYFASVHQATLRQLLGRKFKDPVLLGVFDRIIGSYRSAPGRGLPIGNLTSQHFANFYLAPLDRFLKETLQRGDWSELILQQRMQALLAFVMPAESGAFRRHVLQRFGVAAKGLEPHESGRQLEQQRDQLPDGEPQQQQQPDEQQQQHWVPFCPAPSSTRLPEGGGADPAAILSRGPTRQRANTETPPGASRLVPQPKAPGGGLLRNL